MAKNIACPSAGVINENAGNPTNAIVNENERLMREDMIQLVV